MSPLHKDSAVLESNADRILTVSVSGGELLAFGSANPCVEERYDAGKFATYQGRALAAVRAGASGKVSASVSDGKQTATAEVNVFEKYRKRCRLKWKKPKILPKAVVLNWL